MSAGDSLTLLCSRVLLLSAGFLPTAFFASGGTPPTVEGVVVSADGGAVSGVRLCTDLNRCIESGFNGEFREDLDDWNLAGGVLYLRKPGFVSALVTPEKPWTGLRLSMLPGPTRQVVIGRCPERPAPGHDYVGITMQVLVPEELEVRRYLGQGAAFDVTVESPEETALMKLNWEFYDRALPSRAWLDKHAGFELTEILLDEDDGDPPRLYALDVRATLANGRQSRRIGKPGEYIRYYEVPAAAARSFDVILESLCVGGPQPLRNPKWNPR